jgi:hypothetical protein
MPYRAITPTLTNEHMVPKTIKNLATTRTKTLLTNRYTKTPAQRCFEQRIVEVSAVARRGGSKPSASSWDGTQLNMSTESGIVRLFRIQKPLSSSGIDQARKLFLGESSVFALPRSGFKDSLLKPTFGLMFRQTAPRIIAIETRIDFATQRSSL